MNDFKKELKLYNDKIDELEMKIFELDFKLKYNKILLQKIELKKRSLLSSYKTF
mgnify:CR=1 FL=1